MKKARNVAAWELVFPPQQCPITYRHLSDYFLAKNRITVFLQSLFSPDIAPNDFFLFPRMRRNLKVKNFADVEVVNFSGDFGHPNVFKSLLYSSLYYTSYSLCYLLCSNMSVYLFNEANFTCYLSIMLSLSLLCFLTYTYVFNQDSNITAYLLPLILKSHQPS